VTPTCIDRPRIAPGRGWARRSGERAIPSLTRSRAHQRGCQRALLAVSIAAVDQGNPPTGEATKAAQRAGIVSIGPRHDRYGFNGMMPHCGE
jgi:hypothetical protein